MTCNTSRLSQEQREQIARAVEDRKQEERKRKVEKCKYPELASRHTTIVFLSARTSEETRRSSQPCQTDPARQGAKESVAHL